jgi:hypothetical protein
MEPAIPASELPHTLALDGVGTGIGLHIRTKQNFAITEISVSIILYYDQQMQNYHTPTCFDTIVSSSDSL